MSNPVEITLKKRVLLIGVGGASNSGKTTLAKYLHRLIKNSTIIHLDDFAPAQHLIPYSPLYPDVQDWDSPATAIDWPLLRSSLAYFKQTGQLPDDHQTHDHLNTLEGVSVGEDVKNEVKDLINGIEQKSRKEGVEIVWGILDGFVVYWDEDVLSKLDVRIFLRVPYATLKSRREARSTYVTQSQSAAAAGEVWQDPPNYFDQIVYPAYVLAHQSIFNTASTDHPSPAAKNVEHEEPSTEWTDPVGQGGKGLVVLTPGEGQAGMGKCLLDSVKAVKTGAENFLSRKE
ncbi:p-loop containing nucleoside triphosphate hydrolase protein [Phaffia rhodozyma]|uniref:p-loop containing nucleoside triphosphate hydrolase protein n=1 Tax=Phaffia rhodozyma TaxID=264483 RepID=A0A0F7SIL6_PHARH|nr:p-loop containing nucleoside triphosphate hydrolase protein [Phaffia rhodozyma]